MKALFVLQLKEKGVGVGGDVQLMKAVLQGFPVAFFTPE